MLLSLKELVEIKYKLCMCRVEVFFFFFFKVCLQDAGSTKSEFFTYSTSLPSIVRISSQQNSDVQKSLSHSQLM